ncbi:uncharacterized protein LOC6505128 [Drosophila ananassae]|uniref:uncharacterized protein LOC6505128 n=1 Tax=Drosophila ananassae TaxID=7217 RepID=UPI0013A5D2DB|nr:uncharacterized protein LOC6505128 [Drosophila ananassae]
MKLFGIIFVAACLLVTIEAAPEKTRIGQKSRGKNQDAMVDVVAKDQDVKVGNGQNVAAAAAGQGAGVKDPSSGRLFLKKFLTFKNLFSSNNQPVIPIIITGAGTGTTTGTASPTSPTVTVTSTGTIPSATGTITTSPTSPTSPTTGTTAGRQQQSYGNDDDDQDADQEQQDQAVKQPAAAYPSDLMDEQALQAALAAGAQEYEVVTDDEVQGTGAVGGGAGESKATSSHINLRRKGARRGQVISVRIPPRYRRYFKNGQKVMLNTGSRPGNKRRVVRKRVPAKKFNNRRRGGNKKNRKNRNKNRRTRIIPA